MSEANKYLLISLFILIALFYAADVNAGIIFKPVFHTGLVGYWDFQEGAGSTANDKSGNENHGTLENMATSSNGGWADGKLGSGLNLDGTDDYVDAGDIDLDGIDFTVSAWIKIDDFTDQSTIFFKEQATNFGIIWRVETDGSLEFMENWDDRRKKTAASLISTDTWYHVALVFEDLNNDVTMYVDGDAKANSQLDDAINDLLASDNSFVIGNRIEGNWDPFDGTIDEVRVYNRALSAGEVERLYKLSQPKIAAPTETGLVGYWRFDEGTGTKAGDHSGNGNNGTWGGTGSHWTDGKLGTAGQFNGSDDEVETTDIDITDVISVSAWINPSTNITDWLKIVSKEYTTAWDLSGVSGSTNALTVWMNFTAVLTTGNNAYSPNTWTHVAFTYDKDAGGTDEAKLYVNGILADTGDYSTAIGTNDENLFIGSRSGSLYFPGKIDEVRIYDRALEANEIEVLYKSGLVKINTSQNDKLTDGLVGLWSFNGPDIDGNEAYDRSGEGNHGTLQNGPLPTSGKVGQALEFDGDNDYVELGGPAVLNQLISTNSDFTISSWGYLDTLSGDQVMVGWGHDTVCWVELRYDEGNIEWSFDMWDGGTQYARYTQEDPVLNRWYHVVGVRNGNSIKIYVDGVEGAIPDTVGTLVYSVGRSWNIGRLGTYGREFNGLIDEVRIYNRALSVKEIQRLYNLGR